MKKLLVIIIAFVMTFCLFGCDESKTDIDIKKEENEKLTIDVFAMDTAMSLTAYGENAQEALDKAKKEIERLDLLLSTGKADSEVFLINKNGKAKISEDVFNLTEKSLEIYSETEGAFDITVYPLMEAWGFTTGKYVVPQAEKINSLKEYVDSSAVKLHGKKKSIHLSANVKIDFGGIAKGYTSDRIMKIFAENKVQAGMVSLGGNVQVYNKKPDGSAWRVAIENPDKNGTYLGVLSVSDKAVVTSGGYQRFFEGDGKKYHHIIDPKTGYPAESGLKSVTIISDDGTLADGLSTALFVMGKDKAVAYWEKNSEKFDMILEDENNRIQITSGIEKYFTSDYKYRVVRK